VGDVSEAVAVHITEVTERSVRRTLRGEHGRTARAVVDDRLNIRRLRHVTASVGPHDHEIGPAVSIHVIQRDGVDCKGERLRAAEFDGSIERVSGEAPRETR
jgi:hypothetical protein